MNWQTMFRAWASSRRGNRRATTSASQRRMRRRTMSLERLEDRALLAAISAFEITPTVANNTGLALSQAPAPIGTITSNPTPSYDVVTTDTSIANVNIYADLTGDGLDASDPLLATVPIANTGTTQFSLPSMEDAAIFPAQANGMVNGTRHLVAQAVDATDAQVGETAALTFFLDNTNPYINSITYTDNGANVYSSTPAASVPTSITGITIEFIDPTIRDSSQFTTSGALNFVVANVVSNYSLVGAKTGAVTIAHVNVVNDTTNTATNPLMLGDTKVQLTFATPLPNDSFSLVISQNLVNDANNALFGSTFATPGAAQTVQLPTGYNSDGTPETAPSAFDPASQFSTTFTALSGTGVGVANAQNIQISNLQDATGAMATAANFARPSDVVFAGNFPEFSPSTTAGASANGISKLAAYGKDATGKYRWLFENSDGSLISLYNPNNVNGLPVAGNFNLSQSSAGEALGVFTGTTWYLYSLNLDASNNPSVSLLAKVPWSSTGLPVVGDFDGDTISDLATYNVNTGTFTVAYSSLSPTYSALQQAVTFRYPGVRARPVAANIEGTGVSDLGVWVPDIGGAPSAQKLGDWFFLETGGQPLVSLTSPSTVANYTLAHYQFGSSLAVPFTGLFTLASAVNPGFPATTATATPFVAKAATTSTVMAAAAKTATTALATVKPAAKMLASTKQSFSGSSGNDVFQLSPGKTTGTWNLSVNGVLRQSNALLSTLKLDGLGGKNSLVITGTGKGETADVWSNRVTFRSGNLTLTAANFTNITVVGGGTDTATLHDAAGANTLIANGGTVTLSGTGYSETVKGFASSVVIATSGSNDTADLYKATTSSVASNSGGDVVLTNSATKVRTAYFNTVRVHNPNGAVSNTFTYSKTARVAASSKAAPIISLSSAVPLVTAKTRLASIKAAAAASLLKTSTSTSSQKIATAADALFATYYHK